MEIAMSKSLKKMFVFCILSILSIGAYAQTTKVVIVPLDASDSKIYTGVTPIVVDNTANTITFLAPSDANMQPSLALNYSIALQGVFPSRNASDPFIGEIALFGFNFAPRGWALAEGQILPIATYSALYSLLGTYYGGDGRSTFGLPDLRGRAAIGQGTGPGLDQRRIGQKSGSEDLP
jgi:microcystin-dependent protein